MDLLCHCLKSSILYRNSDLYGRGRALLVSGSSGGRGRAGGRSIYYNIYSESAQGLSRGKVAAWPRERVETMRVRGDAPPPTHQRGTRQTAASLTQHGQLWSPCTLPRPRSSSPRDAARGQNMKTSGPHRKWTAHCPRHVFLSIMFKSLYTRKHQSLRSVSRSESRLRLGSLIPEKAVVTVT